MYTNKFIKVFKTPCMTTFFINFENPIYCSQMIKNICGQSTSLMEEHFTTSKIHYHNIM